MKKKTILIFGAGLNQTTLISAAKELNINTVVIDPDNNAIGKSLADKFYCVKADDYDQTKKIAITNKVDGIVTSQMQNPIRLMSKLAAELGLIFIRPEKIEKSLNKYLMKSCFIENKINCAKGFRFYSEKEINRNHFEQLGFPLILKPTDSHSSRGVFKIESESDLIKYVDITKQYSTDSSFIIEEFVDGPEYSVESITFNGFTTIIQITEKIITPYPYTVEMGHIQPANLSIEIKDMIHLIVKNAIAALDIDNSVSHTELKMTKDGPKIIEIGARLGGDFISSYLTRESTGVNLDKIAIQIALGIKPIIEISSDKFTCIKYLKCQSSKKVSFVEEYNDILQDSSVVLANIFLKKGDIIQEITDSSKRAGFVIVRGKTRDEVIEKADNLLNLLKNKIHIE